MKKKFLSALAFTFSCLISFSAFAENISLDDAYKILTPVVAPAGMMAEPEQTINGESCYIIAAGDNNAEQFVVTNRYAVGKNSKKIYVYDIITDSYEPLAQN